MRNLYVLFCFVLACIGAAAQPTLRTALMPMAANVKLSEGSFVITTEFKISIQPAKTDSVLQEAANRFYQALNRRTGLYFNTEYINSGISADSASMLIHSHNPAVANLSIDESYSLSIDAHRIQLEAPTTQGCLYGLQTILQLLITDGNRWYLPTLSIQDSPRYGWRGLMIDVARHFMPVSAIERNIDAMAAVKFNVLHLHLSDNEGFRVESKLFPLLTRNGSLGEYYSQQDILNLVEYARKRGIIIVPEFDMPAHSASWFAGYSELASLPGPYAPGSSLSKIPANATMADIMKIMTSMPMPTMDPTNETTYRFLDKFFGEMTHLFPSLYYHIGCDENNGVAWTTNPKIVAFMKLHKIADRHALQAYFAERVTAILKKYNKRTIGWEEILNGNTKGDVTAQIWSDASFIKKSSSLGSDMIISRGFYLDLFLPAYIHYNNEILQNNLPDTTVHLIKGGEAALWSEAVDQFNIDTRAWPRAAAIAERLWSSTNVRDVDDMYRRLFIISHQLDEIGLQHLSAYERGLRRMTGGNDITPLRIVTDVLAPVKGYKKLALTLAKPPGYKYQTSPQIEVVDIIPVDSETKRKFRWLVMEYLREKNPELENQVRHQLEIWRDHQPALQPYFDKSTLIGQIKKHSDNLHESAIIGLEALERLKSAAPISPEWMNEKMSILKDFKKQVEGTELDIIPEIEGLVKGQMAPEPSSYPMF